jgi:GNAT superfamily N-acetyltransferase
MPVDAGTAARAFAEAWETLLNSTPGWWCERGHGVVGGITNVRLPTLNGVWAYGADPDRQATEGLLDRVAATELPYCLQAPAEAAHAAEIAARRGMQLEGDVPLMVLEDIAAVAEPGPPGLRIRRLEATELSQHTALAGQGFEVDEAYFRALVSPDVVRLDGFRIYVGHVEAEPVTTGVGFTRGEWVGVFNIATPPAHRRRGYGAAVTVRAVRDGSDAGAGWAWLQASESGRPVYEQLGFRTLVSWRCWISPGAAL